MTAVEIIVVDAHQHLFLVAIELGERVALIDGDTRVQPSRTTLVFNKQHFAMEINESVADIFRRYGTQSAGFELFLVAHEAVVPFLYFDLRVKFRFEEIDIAVVGVESVFLRPLQVVAEHIAEEVRADIGFGQTVPVEAYTLCAEVIVGIGQRRNEMSAEAPYIGLAHLPYTEEAEDMVHAVGIEIILHLAEPRLPPCEVILRHLIPVIGREAPVLSACIEVIGRSTGTGVEIEQLRIDGCIHGVGTDTDRYIALHGYTNAMGVCYCVRQLLVGMELQIFVVLFGLLVAFAEESGIRLQP